MFEPPQGEGHIWFRIPAAVGPLPAPFKLRYLRRRRRLRNV